MNTLTQTNAQLQKILAVAEALAEANGGKKPTLDEVRDALGGGSYTTISKAMKSWKGRHDVPTQKDTTPEGLAKAAQDMVASLWRQAKTQADDQLNLEKKTLEEVRAEFEQEKEEATQLADALTAKNDALKAAQEKMKQDALVLQQELSAMTAKAASAEAALGECRSMLAQVEGQLAKAEARADVVAESAAKDKEQARAENKALQIKLENQAKDLSLVTTKAAAAEAALAECRVRAEQLEKQLSKAQEAATKKAAAKEDAAPAETQKSEPVKLSAIANKTS